MQNISVVQKQEKTFKHGGSTDTSLLKVIALIFMFIDHIGLSMFPGVIELRILGRIAMPLYAWCLVVGSDYTHNIFKYILRVLFLGILSQPIYIIALNHTWYELNIMFTFAIALFAIAAIKEDKYCSKYWVPPLCLLFAAFLTPDYGWKGVLFVILLYISRKNRSTLFATAIAFMLFWGTSSFSIKGLFNIPFPWLKNEYINSIIEPFFKIQTMAWLSLPFILHKTNSGFRIPKLLGYMLYPLHLIILIVIKSIF